MKEEAEKTESTEEDERVVHIWEPLEFTTEAGYDYLRKGFFATLFNGIVRHLAHLIIVPFDKIALGLRVEGVENADRLYGSGAVTVCNHIHYMDCTMVDVALTDMRMYYVTLETNFKIPVVRHLIRALGGVPLSKSPHRMRELFTELEKAVTDGSGVQIYPEGVLVPYCSELRRFRDGAFSLAVNASAPILPMAITYAQPKGIYALYKRKPCFTISILPPIYLDTTLDKKQAVQKLKQECEDAMRKRINGI